jgi:SP family sugar:H+ symporter-like MFS transporter
VIHYGNWVHVIIGLVNFLPCIPAYFLIQRFGRKTILTWGSFGMLISLIPCSVTFLLTSKGMGGDVLPLLSLVFLCLYIISFAVSLGPLCWTYMTEVMTEKALSIGVAVNLVLTVAAALLAPILFDTMKGYVFVMCAVFAFITFIFCIIVLKETKGLTEKQIQQLFSAMPADFDEGERSPLQKHHTNEDD